MEYDKKTGNTKQLRINDYLYFCSNEENNKIFIADKNGEALSYEAILPSIQDEDIVQIIFSSKLTETAKAITKQNDKDYFRK